MGDNNEAAEASAASRGSTGGEGGSSGEPPLARHQKQIEADDAAGAPAGAGDEAGAGIDGDQVALITGSASGIGRGTARAFAAINYRLALVDKQADRLADTGRLCAASSPKGHKVSVPSTNLSPFAH